MDESDHDRRCSTCGDVLMYCSCFMDFIDNQPNRDVVQGNGDGS